MAEESLKIKLKRTSVNWTVACSSSDERENGSVKCSIDVEHYYNYRQKQNDKIKELEQNKLKQHIESNEPKNKCDELKQNDNDEKKIIKSKCNTIRINDSDDVELEAPKSILSACKRVFEKYVNSLQTTEIKQVKQVPFNGSHTINISIDTTLGIIGQETNVSKKAEQNVPDTTTKKEEENLIKEEQDHNSTDNNKEVKKRVTPNFIDTANVTAEAKGDVIMESKDVDRNQAQAKKLEQITSNMVVNNMFRNVPNEEAMKCLEGFSTWPNFAMHTETGRMYSCWFETGATHPPGFHTASCRKRKMTKQQFMGFGEMQYQNNVPQNNMGPVPSATSVLDMHVPMGPSPGHFQHRCMQHSRHPQIHPVYQQHNYPPVFPAPRIPVTSTMPSGAAVAHDVRPSYIDSSMYTSMVSTRNMQYPPQRPRMMRPTSSIPNYPPIDRNNVHQTYYR